MRAIKKAFQIKAFESNPNISKTMMAFNAQTDEHKMQSMIEFERDCDVLDGKLSSKNLKNVLVDATNKK